MKTRYEIAEEVVSNYKENKLLLKIGFDLIDISNGIDWRYKHTSNVRTYSVYLHTLDFLKSIVMVYEETKEEDLVILANKILTSWYEYNEIRKDIDEFVWNEHAVSNRLHNILYYFEKLGELTADNQKYFDTIIEEHCDFLIDENNYRPNNHGIMMDKALIESVSYIRNEKIKKLYLSKALYRIKLAIFRDFSRRGVHLENSPEYHRMVQKILHITNQTLIKKNIKIGSEEHRLINLAKYFNRIMLKPNSSYPLIGDTGYIYDKYTKKTFEDFVDYDSGTVIFQQEHKDNLEESFYLFFKSGYKRKTHKHKDDLSFILTMDGSDIITDSGKYNYDKKDNLRDYFTSQNAHSTIIISNKDYSYGNPISDQFDLEIKNVKISDDLKVATGINNLYPNCKLKRTVIVTSDHLVIILDEVLAEEKVDIIQNFILSEQLSVSKIDNKSYSMVDNKNTFVIQNLNKNFDDLESSVSESKISYRFNEYDENLKISFTSSMINSNIVTCIYNENKGIKNVQYNNKNNILTYEINSKIKEFNLFD
ncbi:Heparin-sulfate lyase precursor [Jeotgalicoccus saudimassiliensis]|uniref:Heparin-sulfate lyase n=1 Tax=Jeotgalicoccus saudimassiliensis TaxID=1461582 RepID=A0A078M393_9STAP|nr:heparinase II/III family protein [Jeotgalicoccus saudimassiliensis]CDZ99662.1 Heparin-sulfate lyase precursor [Jeotgalicoccus saudimassiliensis]